MKILNSHFSIILIIAALFTGIPAQTRPKTPATKPKCSGAWTGNITYTRTQGITDSQTTPRVSGRGRDRRNFEMRYNYKASVAVLEDRSQPGSNIGKATINHQFTSDEQTAAEEENSCDRGKTWQVMSGMLQTKTEARGNATNAEASVGVGVNSDGTYSVSVGLPSIQGLQSGLQSATYAGQCRPKEGSKTTSPQTPVSIDGNSMTSDGRNRIDSRDPNRISGSYSKSNLGITETISWNLERCGAPLRITDLQFEDMKFPNWNDWQEIDEVKGTVDGNFVKIKAKLINESGEAKNASVRFKETFKGDKWNGARPDAPLKDDVISVRIEANTEESVEIVWDSSGYAWFDDGRPRLLQRIKAELEVDDKKIDEKTENLKVAPKPLVLVHGLWSNWHAWNTWQNILTIAHSYDWKAFPVGEKPEKGKMNTGKEFMSSEQTASIGDNARQLESYVRYAQEDRNAWHVDIVAHSMGGLIARYYISQIMQNYPDNPRPRVSHLVMLGTPNLGSPCADVMDIAFGMIGKSVEAIRQLQQDYVAGFNRINTQRKGVKFSALAGNSLPVMCKTIVANDGVVPVPSAKWILKDTAESTNIHIELTGTSDFSNFVEPHIAIGPKGDHNPAPPEMPDRVALYEAEPALALRGPRADNSVSELPVESIRPIAPDEIDFAKLVKLAANQSVEIEIPVSQAPDFGITFMAVSDVSATLVNDKGAIAGKSAASSPDSRGWFRSIYVNQPTTAGTWRLKFENTSSQEVEAIVATWKNAR